MLSYEKEDTIGNLLITALMYFTYCQLWIYVVFKSLILDLSRYNVGVWDKTVRFKTDDAAAAKAVASGEAADAKAAGMGGVDGAKTAGTRRPGKADAR